jgi:integrase
MAVPVAIAAYGPARPEEQAEMRRPDVSLAPLGIWVRRAAPELTTGRRVVGETKSESGERFMVLPGFMQKDVERHLKWFAQKEPNGLLFVGEKGAPFRRTSFGRKWAKARLKAGLPGNFRVYDLRHTGHPARRSRARPSRTRWCGPASPPSVRRSSTSTRTSIGRRKSPPRSTIGYGHSVRRPARHREREG